MVVRYTRSVKFEESLRLYQNLYSDEACVCSYERSRKRCTNVISTFVLS
jgi:hypothetical protein